MPHAQCRMARLLTANLLFVRLLGVGCGVWGVVSKKFIDVRTRIVLFLLFPYTLHPTPNTQPSQGFYLFLVPFAQCPMPNAQCPMPHAQCPMPNAP
ncbi:hypothetical protein [Nostoc sp. DedQUE04]|uniref:hypothetical protein n=1 Tax=Nostoc sp. DedQUE04 TaxID=3075390 RepID=UPI002AD3888E|nr:hypothetical protein [Nostoc sp. DedQUE04]